MLHSGLGREDSRCYTVVWEGRTPDATQWSRKGGLQMLHSGLGREESRCYTVV